MRKENVFQYLKFLDKTPQWHSLSWEAKGMVISIMSLTLSDTKKYKGTIAENPDKWRNILGFPSKYIFDKNNDNNNFWENYKKELLTWFIYIDENFIEQHPAYKDCLHRYWYPGLPLIQKSKKLKKENNINLKTIDDEKKSFWNFPVISFTKKTLDKHWESSLKEQLKIDLWSTGVELLSNGRDDIKIERTNRAFIGKLIKDFGEESVATEIAKLSIRNVKPADPKAFLRKQLKNNQEGSPKEQKARNQRARVSL